MARVRLTVPYNVLPHREHRSKKGRVESYTIRRERKIMLAKRRQLIEEKYH